MDNMSINSRKLMDHWNGSKKSKGKNLGLNMFPNVASAQKMPGLSFKQAMGINVKMVGGPSQKQYLRSVKRKPVADRMIDYFTDSDGDMVVNALDCFGRDSRRHGFFAKAKNLVTGKGYRENDDLSQQNNQEQVTQAQKIEDARAEGWKNRVEKEQMEQTLKSGESYSEMEQRQRKEREKARAHYNQQVSESDSAINEYEDYKRSNEYKGGSEKDNELFKKMQKEMADEKAAKEKLKYASQWHGERKEKAQEEFESQLKESKREFNQPEKLVDEVEEPNTLWGTVKDNLKRKRDEKIKNIHQGFAGMTGYIFEKRDTADQLKQRKIEQLKQRAEAIGIDPKKLKELEERRRGFKEYQKPIKEHGKIVGYTTEKVKLSSAETLSDSAFKQILGEGISEKQKQKSIKEKKEKLEVLQRQREAEYQGSLIGLSRLQAQKYKAELSRLPLEQQKARAVTEMDIARAKSGKLMAEKYYQDNSVSNNLDSFFAVNRQQTTNNTLSTPSMMTLQDRPFISNTGFFNVPTEPKGTYDPNAAKFVYKKSATSFTRKSMRIQKGKDPMYGDVLQPSTKKRKDSPFPWTKPMVGFTRVYVGKGRFINKGRRKKTKPKYDMKLKTKAPKRGFSAYFSTYKM